MKDPRDVQLECLQGSSEPGGLGLPGGEALRLDQQQGDPTHGHIGLVRGEQQRTIQ